MWTSTCRRSRFTTETVRLNNAQRMRQSLGDILLYFLIFFLASGVASVPLILFYDVEVLTSPNPSAHPALLFFYAITQFVGMIVASYVMMVRKEGKAPAKFGVSFLPVELFKGLGVGFMIMTLFSLVMSLSGLIKFQWAGFSSALLVGVIYYLLVALVEEVVFRGYVLFKLAQHFSPRTTLIVSSILFGLAHVFNDHVGAVGLLTISLSGFLMGALTWKNGNLSAAIGLHWAWNFFQGSVFGFAVSGKQETGLFQPVANANTPLSGGAFGAEGSLVLTALVGCWLAYDFFQSRRGKSQFF